MSRPLVSINHIEVPDPSEYNATTSTLVDEGRNTEGAFIGSVIRNELAKVEMKWNYLSAQQWADILAHFKASFVNSVTFLNQDTNQYETRSMYVSDRTGGAACRDPRTKELKGWQGCRLALIEV